MIERVKRDCKRALWLVGNLSHLTVEQMRRNMALALSSAYASDEPLPPAYHPFPAVLAEEDVLACARLACIWIYHGELSAEDTPLGYRVECLQRQEGAEPLQWAVLRRERCCVVCFRGSQSPLDWMINLGVLPTPPAGRPGSTAHGLRCHSQMHTALHCSGAEDTCERIGTLLSQLQRTHGQLTVTLTGHSLGGAYALLLAADLLHARLDSDIALRVLAFGAPQVVVSEPQHALWRRLAAVSVLVANELDVLPRLPFAEQWLFSEDCVLRQAALHHGAARLVESAVSLATGQRSALDALLAQLQPSREAVSGYAPCGTTLLISPHAHALQLPDSAAAKRRLEERPARAEGTAVIDAHHPQRYVATLPCSRPEGVAVVCDHWNPSLRQLTFHMGAPWEGEELKAAQFCAYVQPKAGTVPIYDFWNRRLRQLTFHMGAPWAGEELKGLQFYAFSQPEPGTVPIYDFWHRQLRQLTFHAGEPWAGEERKAVQFYAYPCRLSHKYPEV